MPKIEKYVCDYCGAERGATNHWFMVRWNEGLHILPWTVSLEDSELKLQYACGEQCVTKALNDWLGKPK